MKNLHLTEKETSIGKTFYLLLLSIFIITLSGCWKDIFPDEDPIVQNESVTKKLSSDSEGGTLSLEGSTLLIPPNSIPQLASGADAEVAFTIEAAAELPKPLPSGMKAIEHITHFGPEGFIFNDNLWLLFDLPDDVAVDQVSIVGYLPDVQDYGIIPITYYDEDNRVVGANVYELGYYFLVNVEGVNRARSPQSPGGFHLNIFNTNGWYPNTPGLTPWVASNTYYKIIVTEFIPDNPNEVSLWASYDRNSTGGRRYMEFMTPPVVTGWGPNHNIGIKAIGLPQGQYKAKVVASHKFGQMDLPECKVYSKDLVFTISNSLECNFSGCSGYDNGPNLPANGVWQPINCNNYRPEPTIPVCTGDFQATLTWFNGTSGDSDLDLHLKGPDGLHVYWSNPEPGVGSLLLDRDVIDDPGPVQENICAPSLDDLPKGDYEVFVHLFDGMHKSFQVRVIVGSHSSSFQGNITTSNPEIKVHSFKIN